MKDLLIYQLEVAACISVFYLFYWLLLRKETNFSFRRIYLISASGLSFLIPFLNIRFAIKSNEIPIDYLNFIPQQIIYFSPQPDQQSEITPELIFSWIWVIGLVIMAMRLVASVYYVNKIVTKATPQPQDNKIKLTQANIQSFSFFKTIVLSQAHFHSNAMKYILAHEQAHTNQYHSLDVFCMEVLKSFQWFNPVAWLFANEAIQNLEYLADQNVVRSMNDKQEYQMAIVQFAHQGRSKPLHSEFSKSNLKNRIIMLNLPNTQKIKAWKFLLLLPLIGTMLMSFSIKIENLDLKQEVVDILPLLSESTNEITVKEEEQAFETQKSSVEIIAESTGENQTLSASKNLPKSEFTLTSKQSQSSITTRDTLQNETFKINSKDGKSPLFIVDSKEISKSEFEAIDPESIESISVLKDTYTKSKYGEKGKNGVVEIKLKDSYTPTSNLYNQKNVVGYPSGNSLNTGTGAKIGFDISLLNKNDTVPDNNKEIKIRETEKSGIDTENPPIIYKDGVEITMEEMGKIDPESIKSIEVTKDKMAIEKYGEKGKNGVLNIHMKTQADENENLKNQLEHLPNYQEGMDAFYKTIQQKIKYPQEARKNSSQGKVFVSFTVNKKGKIEDIKAEEKKYVLLNEIVVVGYANSEGNASVDSKTIALLEKEVVDVIKQLNQFDPAIQNGKPVNARMTLPVTFKLD